jgi:hypothetical protein
MRARLHAPAGLLPWALLLLVTIAVIACGRDQTPHVEVEIGVFYGGQVQKLERIEFDRSRPPLIGMHLTIDYEVVSVGPAGRRVTQREQFSVPADRRQIDQIISVPSDARLGIWNVRVTGQDRVLADRALYLVEPGQI